MWKQVSLSIALILGMATGALAYSEIQPVGTTKYDPSKAWNGYVLVDVEMGKDSYAKLVDMNGNEVHRWSGTVGMPSKALPNGQIFTSVGDWKDGQQDKIALQLLDWDGKVVWEFRKFQAVKPIEGQPVEDGKSWVVRQHHDYQPHGMAPYYTPGDKLVEKGKMLILGHRNISNPRIHETLRLLDDVAYEVSWDGKVLWEYVVNEHVDDYGFSEVGFAAMKSYPPMDNPRALVKVQLAGKKEGGGFDWFHANSLSYVGPNKWYDQGDKRFHPDNILINSREGNVFGIIDRETKKIVWRVGPYYHKGTPDEKIGQIVGPHGVHMIPKGLPGEGNIMVFDNGGLGGYGEPNVMSPTGFLNARRDFSRVIEFNPVTKEIIWEYKYALTSKRSADHYAYHFYSPFTSIAQRLPNGNTMITEGDTNRLLEVTRDRELVWEYMVPEKTISTNPLYRAYRLPYEWVPQLPKPTETAVYIDPLSFVLPDVNGKYPKILGGKSQITTLEIKSGASSKLTKDKKEDDQPKGMHSY